MSTTREDPLPLDQVHARGLPCPMCGSPLRRDGIMDGSRYPDGCSRPWYVCDNPTCCAEMDGATAHRLQESPR